MKTFSKFKYVNSIPGDVVCSKCQHVFSFSVIEKFFTKSHKSVSDFERARDLFMRAKPKKKNLTIDTIQKGAVPVLEIQNAEIQEVVEHLGLLKIDKNAFQGVHAFCHLKMKKLYFPMHDNDSNIVGFKKLSRSTEGQTIETTYPETNSFGAVIFPPITKRGFRDQRTAILVVNMPDALALRMEKSNGE